MMHPKSVAAAVRGRLRALLRRSRVERDFSDEIHFHIQMETENNIRRGMTPDSARRAATLAFGGVERMREEHRDARGTRWLEDIAADLRFAARSLRKNSGFATAVTLTLMLGIGATAAVFSVAYGVLLRPLPYADAARVMRLWSRNDSRQLEFFSVSPADFAVWRERNHVFSAMGAFERQRTMTLTRGGEIQSVDVAAISPDAFSVLGTSALLGRRIVDADAAPGAPPTALLAHDLWTTRFGSDSAMLGRQLVLDGRQLTVIGVMPPRFMIPGSAAQIWTPLSLAGASPDHSNRYLRVLARLRPGVTMDRARTEADRVAAQLGSELGDTNRDWRVSMMSVPEMVVGRQWRRAVIVLVGVVAFVLLIACANAANLQLARGASRRREIALRATLGARRARIVSQLLAESAVLAVCGGASGLALAYVGVSLLRSLGADSVPRIEEIGINAPVLAFTAMVTVASAFLFGIIPALGASRTDLADALKEGGRSANAGMVGRRARAALVVAQVALSLVLLVGAGLLMRSFMQLQHVELGFDPAGVQVASLRLPEDRYGNPAVMGEAYGAILTRTRALPGVSHAAIVSSPPFAGPNTGLSFVIPERPPAPGEPAPDADLRIVSDDYFRTVGISVVRGRDFTSADRADAPPVVVINEAAAHSYWPDADPLGRDIQLGTATDPKRHTIVGVVRDARYGSLDSPVVRPMVYFSMLARPTRTLSLVARSEDQANFANRLRETLRGVDAELPQPVVSSMETLVHQALATQRFALALFAIFALTALLLAAIGIYGVLSYLVRQRTLEMGIRTALGAPSRTLVREIVASAMRLALPGIAIGLAGAWLLTRFMASLLFDVTATDAPTFVGVGMLLAVTAAVASLLPARRATRVDPMLALRGG